VTRAEVAAVLLDLTPQERAEVENLVVEKLLRDASERHRLRDPKAATVAETHAREIVAGLKIPPEADGAIRAALAEVARVLLAER